MTVGDIAVKTIACVQHTRPFRTLLELSVWLEQEVLTNFLETFEMNIVYCKNVNLAECILAEGYIPGNPSCKFVFNLSIMDLYRNLNLAAGISHHGFIKALTRKLLEIWYL